MKEKLSFSDRALKFMAAGQTMTPDEVDDLCDRILIDGHECQRVMTPAAYADNAGSLHNPWNSLAVQKKLIEKLRETVVLTEEAIRDNLKRTGGQECDRERPETFKPYGAFRSHVCALYWRPVRDSRGTPVEYEFAPMMQDGTPARDNRELGKIDWLKLTAPSKELINEINETLGTTLDQGSFSRR